MSIHQSLQLIVQNQAALVPVSTDVAAPVPPIAEPVHEELAQGATQNAADLWVARHPASTAKEDTIFVKKAEVEALVQREKEKVSSAATYLSLTLPYVDSIAIKPYPMGYTLPIFQKFDSQKEI